MRWPALALAILREQWDARAASGRKHLARLQETLQDVERKVDLVLNRLVDATRTSVVVAYERRVRELEGEEGPDRRANRCRGAVLKLAFAGRLQYARETGYRTAEFSIPFKMLDRSRG